METKKMIVVIGPSGAGKSTLVGLALKEILILEDVITHTTRNMRQNESEKNPYYFTSVSDFQEKSKSDFFVEWAQVHANFYGTSKAELERIWNQKKIPILDVDIQGAKKLKEKFPQSLLIFIKPHSLDALRDRLKDRGSPSEEIALRMESAQKEILFASKCDYEVLNEKIDDSYEQFKKIIENFIHQG